MTVRDWLWVVLLGSIWGTSFLFNAILLREIGPLWISAFRVGIGALGCWAFFFALNRKLPAERGIYVHFFILGALSYAIPFALFPISQQYLTSGVTAIINAMTPIMTVIISNFWPGGERASLNKSIGVVAGFLGVAILASPALMSGGASQVWAVGTSLMATVCYAVALNYTRNFKHIDPSALAACALTGATAAIIPVAWWAHGAPALLTFEGWGAALGIGLIATAFAFQIMYRILPRIGATNFSVVTFIAPLFAITLGIFLLGETIQIAHIVGMLGIFAGLLMIDGRITRLIHVPASR